MNVCLCVCGNFSFEWAACVRFIVSGIHLDLLNKNKSFYNSVEQPQDSFVRADNVAAVAVAAVTAVTAAVNVNVDLRQPMPYLRVSRIEDLRCTCDLWPKPCSFVPALQSLFFGFLSQCRRRSRRRSRFDRQSYCGQPEESSPKPVTRVRSSLYAVVSWFDSSSRCSTEPSGGTPAELYRFVWNNARMGMVSRVAFSLNNY